MDPVVWEFIGRILAEFADNPQEKNQLATLFRYLQSESPQLVQAARHLLNTEPFRSTEFVSVMERITMEQDRWINYETRMGLLRELMELCGNQWKFVAAALYHLNSDHLVQLDLACSVLTQQDLENLIVWV